MAAPFNKQQTNNKDLELLQANIQAAIAPLQSLPMVGGNVVKSVSLASGKTNSVPHGLGRTPSYWIVVDNNANSVVWRSQASDSKFLYLQCTANCTVSIWVN